MNPLNLFVNAAQTILWAAASGEYKPFDGRWTHEDNDAVAGYGWMLVMDTSGVYQLLNRGRSLHDRQEPDDMFARMEKLAPVDPFCAKAVALLIAQKLRGQG